MERERDEPDFAWSAGDDGRSAHRKPRCHVILNPVSGRRSQRERMRRVVQVIATHVDITQFTTTRRSGDARDAASAARGRDADALIVIGGDGTVREAAEGIGDPTTPSLIVPCGTENVMAKYLGLRLDAEFLPAVLRKGRTLAMDAAVCGDRLALFVTGVGFDAEAVRRLAMARRGHASYLSWIGPIVSTFLTFRPPNLRVTVDEEPIFEGRCQVLVGSVPRYALGLRIFDRAVGDDGMLDVCILALKSNVVIPWHAMNILAGQHVGQSGVTYCQGRRITITSDEPVPVQMDGDAAGWTPVEIAVRARSAAFFVPNE